MVSGKTLFIALMTASTFILFGDQKGYQLFSRGNEQRCAVCVSCAKSSNRTGYIAHKNYPFGVKHHS